MSIDFNKKEKAFVERILKKLQYVQWDRFVKHGIGIRVYGWIDRKDEYMDFVLLDINPTRRKIRGFNTSSKEFSDKIARDLNIEKNHGDCIRVEKHFKINNMIKLKD